MRKSLGILSLALAVLLCACGSAALADSTLRIAAGDTVVFGSYEQDGDTGNGAEPIQWLVLDTRGEGDAAGAGVLLISQYELSYRKVHDQDGPATWETSSLRAWLNGEFLSTAFTEREREFVARTHVSTPGNFDDYIEVGEAKKADNPDGNDTEDSVFLLSYEEAERYFRFGTTDEYAAAAHRLTAPSYAAFVDACVNNYTYTAEELFSKAEYDSHLKALPQLRLREGAWEIDLPTLDEYAAFWNSGVHTVGDSGPDVSWRLRTPGYREGGFCYVYKDGSVSDWGDSESSSLFIRPALWLSADAFADAGIAARATPVTPNVQVDEILTGTWKAEDESGQVGYFRFDADGYSMAIAVPQYGPYGAYPYIFEAGNGKLRVMQVSARAYETILNYQLTSPGMLTLTGEGAPGVLTRVDDGEFPLAQESALEIPTGQEAQSGADAPAASPAVGGGVETPDALSLSLDKAYGIPDAYFESPEAAIAYFAECVKNQDLLRALGATRAQPAAENYDLAAMVERTGTYMPAAATELWLPSEYEAYVPFNALTALETRRVFNFVTALLAGGRPLTGPVPARWNPNTGAFEEDESALSGLTAEQMIDMLDPARLSGLELVAIYRYEGEEVLTENYQRIALGNGIIYGFGECWDYLAIYELDGQRYVHTCTAVRYPRGWKIFRLFSYYILDSDYSSEVVPAEKFAATLAEPEYVPTWKDGAADPAKALQEADTTRLVGRWEASTEETVDFMEFIEFREDGTCQVSEDGEIVEGVWNANSLCVAMGESVRAMRGYLYALEGGRLTLIYDSERYVFARR